MAAASAGATLVGFLAPLLAQAEESAIATLGPSRFEAEREIGKRLSREDAIGPALGEPAQAAETASDGERAGPLGKRQA